MQSVQRLHNLPIIPDAIPLSTVEASARAAATASRPGPDVHVGAVLPPVGSVTFVEAVLPANHVILMADCQLILL